MFIEPTITWVPSGFSGFIWLDITKIVLKKTLEDILQAAIMYFERMISSSCDDFPRAEISRIVRCEQNMFQC